VPGGAEVLTACDDGEPVGGACGGGFAIGGGDGYPGVPEPSSTPYGYGRGGGGERPLPECQNGIDGRSGADGFDGPGAQGPGTLSTAGWGGANAGRGQDGARKDTLERPQ
jgi:hypothetical protein